MTEIRGALERVVASSESPEELCERVAAAYGEEYVSLARQIAAERRGFDWLRRGIPRPPSISSAPDAAVCASEVLYFERAHRVAKKVGVLVAVCVGISWAGIEHFGDLGLLKLVVALAMIAVVLGTPVTAWYGIPVLVRTGRLHNSRLAEGGLIIAFALLPVALRIYEDPWEIHPSTMLRVAEGSGALVAKCFIASIAGWIVTRTVKLPPEWRRSQPFIGLAVASWWLGLQSSTAYIATETVAIVMSSWFGYFVGRISARSSNSSN